MGENERDGLGSGGVACRDPVVCDLDGDECLMAMFLSVLLVFLLIFLRFFLKSKRSLVYSDATGAGKVLVNKKWGIRGKPDEIWKMKDGTYFVVEYKSGMLKRTHPYDGDRLQLAAYFLLVEETYQAKKIRGEIRYQNRVCKVEWTPQLKEQLLTVIQQMREVEQTNETRVNIYLPKCRQCEFYKVSCTKV